MWRQLEGLIVYPASDKSIGGGLDPHLMPAVIVMDHGLGSKGVDFVGLKNEDAGNINISCCKASTASRNRQGGTTVER